MSTDTINSFFRRGRAPSTHGGTTQGPHHGATKRSEGSSHNAATVPRTKRPRQIARTCPNGVTAVCLLLRITKQARAAQQMALGSAHELEAWCTALRCYAPAYMAPTPAVTTTTQKTLVYLPLSPRSTHRRPYKLSKPGTSKKGGSSGLQPLTCARWPIYRQGMHVSRDLSRETLPKLSPRSSPLHAATWRAPVAKGCGVRALCTIGLGVPGPTHQRTVVLHHVAQEVQKGSIRMHVWARPHTGYQEVWHRAPSTDARGSADHTTMRAGSIRRASSTVLLQLP